MKRELKDRDGLEERFQECVDDIGRSAMLAQQATVVRLKEEHYARARAERASIERDHAMRVKEISLTRLRGMLSLRVPYMATQGLAAWRQAFSQDQHTSALGKGKADLATAQANFARERDNLKQASQEHLLERAREARNANMSLGMRILTMAWARSQVNSVIWCVRRWRGDAVSARIVAEKEASLEETDHLRESHAAQERGWAAREKESRVRWLGVTFVFATKMDQMQIISLAQRSIAKWRHTARVDTLKTQLLSAHTQSEAEVSSHEEVIERMDQRHQRDKAEWKNYLEHERSSWQEAQARRDQDANEEREKILCELAAAQDRLTKP